MYMTLFCCFCLGFYRCWDFFYFWGVFLGEKIFLNGSFEQAPPHPIPINLFAFFLKKKKKRKRKKDKKKSKPFCLSVPKPFHQES